MYNLSKMMIPIQRENVCMRCTPGYILSLFYFIHPIHKYDIVYVSNYIYSLLYAVDTNIFISSDVDKLMNIMNIELKQIATWQNVNILKFNVKKTSHDIFLRAKCY